MTPDETPTVARRAALMNSTARPVTSDEAPLPPRAAARAAGLSLPSLWRAVAAGRLPAPVYPSPKAPRWFASEIRSALEATRQLPREAMATRRAAKLAEMQGRAA